MFSVTAFVNVFVCENRIDPRPARVNAVAFVELTTPEKVVKLLTVRVLAAVRARLTGFVKLIGVTGLLGVNEVPVRVTLPVIVVALPIARVVWGMAATRVPLVRVSGPVPRALLFPRTSVVPPPRVVMP